MAKNNDWGIGSIAVFESKGLSPYENLAIEKYIMTHLSEDEAVLYLWRNADTVVIGRNQNCWRECRVSELLADGGRIARRLSGGGAVYHDSGNLNFSFIAHDAHYDVTRQLEIIAAACRRFGIDASVSGRNDLLADGAKKFSGNAFFSLGGEGERVNCHHGCILIATDTAKIEKYLSVSKEKLQSKGVRSVRSRVVNLSALSEEISADSLGAALVAELEARAGMPARVLDIPLGEDEIRNDTEFFASDEWLYGRKIDFTDRFGARFDWGEIELCFEVSSGIVKECRVFSDCMDPALARAMGGSMEGVPFSAQELRRALDVALAMLPSDSVMLGAFAKDDLSKTVADDVGKLLSENI